MALASSALHACTGRRLGCRALQLRRRLCCAAAGPPHVFCSPLPSGGAPCELSAEEAKHVAKALRCAAGDRLVLFDGGGRSVECEIAAVSPRGAVTVAAVAAVAVHEWAGPKWRLCVGVAGLAATRGDWLVEKASELGAFSLQPVLPLGQAGEETGGREERARWQRLATAAAKQCLRLHALVLLPALPLDGVLETLRRAGGGGGPCGCPPSPSPTSPPPLLLVAAQGGLPLRSALSGAALAGAVRGGGTLVVGPPAGHSEAEGALMAAAGALPVALGPLRLRTETAALALLAAVRTL